MSFERAYPLDRFGCPVDKNEIWLPETHLSDKRENKNNDHRCFTGRSFGRSVLFNCFRNLESHQDVLFKDVHQWKHERYSYCPLPTPKQAMDRLEQAYWEEENLKIRKTGGYILRLVDLGIYKQCDEEYNKLAR